MKVRIKHVVTLALCLTAAGSAMASGGEALAKAKGCFSCHEANAENLGPSFKDISRRFSGLQNAKRMLSREIQVGTGTASSANMHHWGNVKMPKGADRVPVTQEEADQLVDYILSVK